MDPRQPGGMVGRPITPGGAVSPRQGVPGNPLMEAEQAFANFAMQYILGFGARTRAWGEQAMLEHLLAAGPIPTPGGTPAQETAPDGSYQALADEMGVRPRQAQRQERLGAQQQRRDARAQRQADGGTITTGDIDPNASVTLTANGGMVTPWGMAPPVTGTTPPPRRPR